MPITNPQELLDMLQDPDELDRLAGLLADTLPPPDLNNPEAPLLPPELMQGLGQPGAVPSPVAPPAPLPGLVPRSVAPQGPRVPGTSPSIDFAAQLLAGGR